MFPVVIHTVSTLHFYYPVFPQIPLRFSTWNILTEKPWNAIRPFNFDIQPSTIGLSYLMSLEISFSLWVFYLIYKLERLIGSATGISSYLYIRGFVPYREMGAYLILIIFFCFVEKGNTQKTKNNEEFTLCCVPVLATNRAPLGFSPTPLPPLP